VRVSRVLVMGGSGFIGRHVVAELARRGIKVTVPSRRRERAKHLILLPTVDVVEADINRRGVLDRLARDHDAVINLVGVLHGNFARAHVELALAAVSACRSAGVKRLVHMSALGAAPDSPSEYQRTKARGEQAVIDAADLTVTVFRPSAVFGPEDQFLNQFATLARFSPLLAVPCPHARFQPVYVGDVARAFAASLGDTEAYNRGYELGGPRQYPLTALIELVCAITGRPRLVVGLPDSLSYVQALVLEHLPGTLMTRDNYHAMRTPNVTGSLFPFGIVPQSVEAAAPAWRAPAGPRERYPQLRWRARR
jgi:uncharacterized protein YbjT (DUF2867 family)